MIRHIELVKLNEVVDGKFRQEQLEELTALIESVLEETEGIVAHKIDYKTSLDPVDADLYVQVDFDTQDALDEYGFSVEHLAASIKIAEHATAMLEYDIALD